MRIDPIPRPSGNRYGFPCQMFRTYNVQFGSYEEPKVLRTGSGIEEPNFLYYVF